MKVKELIEEIKKNNDPEIAEPILKFLMGLDPDSEAATFASSEDDLKSDKEKE